MKLTILGCGTSGGVPKVPEFWGACDPLNPKNRRTRASVMVETDTTRVVVDTTPDFRQQMLRHKVLSLDAVLYSHDHADHTHGIDDLRGFYQKTGSKLPVYADSQTLKVLKRRFEYIFEDQGGYPAICTGNELSGGFSVGDIHVIPFTQIHGQGTSVGFRFDDFAYSTDLNKMTDEGFQALEGVKVWVVDALRYAPHPTHSHLDQTLAWIDKIRPETAILTHMTWDMDYEALQAELPAGVIPGFDGLEVSL